MPWKSRSWYRKAKYGGGVKTLNGSQPSDYFNILSPNKDIKKQCKKPSLKKPTP
jgi:hypothetical protein